MLFSRSLFSVFAFTCLLLLSSAAVSVQASEQSFTAISPKLINSDNNYQLNPIECPKSQHLSQASSHHCCGSVCLLKIPNNHSISLGQISLPLLAPLGLDDIGEAITRSRTLYRPPIA